MTTKYDIDEVGKIKSNLYMPEPRFYDFYINKEALKFLGETEVRSAVKELLNDGDDFTRSNDDLDRLYSEELFDEVHGPVFANYISDHSDNMGDESEFEGAENPVVEVAIRAYADDVFARAAEIFEEIKEEYESALENVGTVIDGFRSGEIAFEESNAYHIVAAAGLASELDLTGSLAEVASQFRTVDLPESASLYISPEHMSTVTEFASSLAIDLVYDDKRDELYPKVTAPGSVEEAAAILYYLEEAGKRSRDGGLGSESIGYATDPDIRTMIFCEYDDNMVAHMLGGFNPNANESLESYQAAALTKAFKGNSLGVEGAAFVQKHIPEAEPSRSHRAVIPLLDVTIENAISGKVTLDNLKELTAARDLHSAFPGDLRRYLAIFHPEVAKLHVMQTNYGSYTTATTLLGLMDGSASGKAALASMKESVNAQVPAPSKALGVFRKTLYPDNPAPQGPALR